VIRVFNRYVHLRTYLGAMLDFGVVAGLMLGIFLATQGTPGDAVSLTMTHGLPLAAVVTLAAIATGLYRDARLPSFVESSMHVTAALTIGMCAAWWGLRASGGNVSGAASTVAMLAVSAVLLNRAFVWRGTGRAVRRTRVLIVGCGAAAAQAAQAVHASDPHAQVVGYLGGDRERELAVPAAEIVHEQGSVVDAAVRLGATQIVVALSERRGGEPLLRDLLTCKVKGIRVCDISTHFEKTLGQIRLEFVNPGWLVFGGGFNQSWFRSTVKRCFDIACALVLSILAAPIMLLTIAAIALDSKGPIFYRQQRTGLNGKPFEVVKFRSMYTDAERDGPRWAAAADHRITRVGRLIRMMRIDELPQLFNVLRGNMSVVGPRPERPFFVDQLVKETPYYDVRHSIKPGITGWAQVRYHYGATVEDSMQKLQYDLYYVKNHTLFLDLVILAETAAVVLLGKGAR
jgi:sugar transferase (PEP-CTERM system associated)